MRIHPKARRVFQVTAISHPIKSDPSTALPWLVPESCDRTRRFLTVSCAPFTTTQSQTKPKWEHGDRRRGPPARAGRSACETGDAGSTGPRRVPLPAAEVHITHTGRPAGPRPRPVPPRPAAALPACAVRGRCNQCAAVHAR
jgi:hypothetical protein